MSKLVLLNHESLTVEFTSEASRPQIDDELVDNVVALSNTEKNGSLYLGIEDNGTVTGVSREHRSVDGLAVFIFFSKTVPQVAWCVLKSSVRTTGCRWRVSR